MAISLYDVSVASYLQTLGAMSGFLDKALKHFRETGADPDAIVEARVHPDMLPFKFQIRSVAHHSLGAIRAIQSGEAGPPGPQGDVGFASLQREISDARDALVSVTPEEVEACVGKDVIFRLGSFQIPFAAEKYILSFSLPNFHFHATTAYAILRSAGVPLGKRDFLGQLQIKT